MKRLVDLKQTADFINDFFVNIGPNLSKNIKEAWKFNGHHTDLLLDDINTNIEEVTKLCNNININKSSCIENLSAEILRDAFLAIPEKITELFNCSFISSQIPASWKVAKVTPLQKPGNTKDVSNLRPVSLLPLPSKLIEKIGRVRKNSGGKRQADYQPQVTTGKRRPDRLLVLGGCTHRPEISGISLVRYLSGQSQRRQRWQVPAIYLCSPVAGTRLAIFPPLFFAPSLLSIIEYITTAMLTNY